MADKVPFRDLRPQNAQVRDQTLTRVAGTLESSEFILGRHAEEFETAFAEYIGAKHCIAVNNGTSALHLALRALDVGPGDEVITVAMSFVATAWPILYVGATPVFVDIDPNRFTMSPRELVDAITPQTRAIVVVHLYGQCADMTSILEVARAHNIPVIEDAAQAAGAKHLDAFAGSLGCIGCFSFYPSKPLGGIGDGGAVITSDDNIADRVRVLRHHGQRQIYEHETLGYNYRLSEVIAAGLMPKLPLLDGWLRECALVAEVYLSEFWRMQWLGLPSLFPGRHAWHLFTVSLADRDEFRAFLASCGIETAVHYPIPIHKQPPFAESANVRLAATEHLSASTVSLPLFPGMTELQVHRVVDAVCRWQPRSP